MAPGAGAWVAAVAGGSTAGAASGAAWSWAVGRSGGGGRASGVAGWAAVAERRGAGATTAAASVIARLGLVGAAEARLVEPESVGAGLKAPGLALFGPGVPRPPGLGMAGLGQAVVGPVVSGLASSAGPARPVAFGPAGVGAGVGARHQYHSFENNCQFQWLVLVSSSL